MPAPAWVPVRALARAQVQVLATLALVALVQVQVPILPVAAKHYLIVRNKFYLVRKNAAVPGWQRQ